MFQKLDQFNLTNYCLTRRMWTIWSASIMWLCLSDYRSMRIQLISLLNWLPNG